MPVLGADCARGGDSVLVLGAGAGCWLGAGCRVLVLGAGYRCWVLVLGAVSWRAGARLVPAYDSEVITTAASDSEG